MRTHVELDDEVLDQVMDLGQYPSKKMALNIALLELAKLLKRRQLLDLQGAIAWTGDLNALRESRTMAAAA
jgi:Arc/MetJ family transcription regulator